MITKAVIPAAGLGTGMLPITKEIPKEMLPIILRQKEGYIVKPILQVVFEKLYSVGFRNYCIIVGRGKRAIEDYFTPDIKFMEQIERLQNGLLIGEVKKFYEKIKNSMIIYINQPKPRGLGDAILRVRKFVKDEDFLVHAGDTFLYEGASHILNDVIDRFYSLGADVFLLATHAKPRRKYRYFIELERRNDINRVIKISEKAKRSNIVLIHIYLFSNKIFDILEGMKDKKIIKITDAINRFIQRNGKVYAYILDKEIIDINVPEIYLDVLKNMSILNDYMY